MKTMIHPQITPITQNKKAEGGRQTAGFCLKKVAN